MWAIYFIDPETNIRYPCTSSSHWWFGPPSAIPALFVSHANAAKVFRRNANWAKMGFHDLMIRPTDDSGHPVEVTGGDDLGNCKIVPIIMTPDWPRQTEYNAKSKKIDNPE